MSQWGISFRPNYRKLGEIRDIIPNTPILALTATATKQMREDIERSLRLNSPCSFVTSIDRPNLTFSIHRKTNSFENDLMRWVNMSFHCVTFYIVH